MSTPACQVSRLSVWLIGSPKEARYSSSLIVCAESLVTTRPFSPDDRPSGLTVGAYCPPSTIGRSANLADKFLVAHLAGTGVRGWITPVGPRTCGRALRRRRRRLPSPRSARSPRRSGRAGRVVQAAHAGEVAAVAP